MVAAEMEYLEAGVRFIEIRKLRNRIAHKYAESEEDISGIYWEVLLSTPLLFDSVSRIFNYCRKHTSLSVKSNLG